MCQRIFTFVKNCFMSLIYDPLPGFYFQVNIDGSNKDSIDAAFQEVSGISMEMETTPLKEGGQNFVSRKLPGYTTYDNLELKRGMSAMNSKLVTWCFNTFGNNSNGTIEPKAINIQLFNAEREPMVSWNFVDAYPIKWQVGGFNAQDSSIIIENISLAYSYFEIDVNVGKGKPRKKNGK